MLKHLPFYATFVALGLIAITRVSWEYAHGLAFPGGAKGVATLILLIAFLKTRFVLLDFMDLKRSPLAARVFAEAWWLGCFALLSAILWNSPIN